MHYSWQSWDSSLVFSTAFDFFFFFFFPLATILTNTELDVFAEQPGIFFAYAKAVVYAAGLSSCPTDTAGLDQALLLRVHLEMQKSKPMLIPDQAGCVSPPCPRAFDSSYKLFTAVLESIS